MNFCKFLGYAHQFPLFQLLPVFPKQECSAVSATHTKKKKKKIQNLIEFNMSRNIGMVKVTLGVL